VFTLASPYAILAHYYELEWAKGYGVESNLVRVSVGLEDYEYLEGLFSAAVDAAEAAEKKTVR
jgi:cystathionine gamma-synthase